MTEVFNIHHDLYYGIIDLDAFARKEGLSGKREIETKGKDALMAHLAGGPCDIYYDDKGKPFLKDNSAHISVSHSHDRLAIIVNRVEPTGIDIELIRSNVLKIRSKFMRQEELEAAGDHIEKLLVYWAAKETLYKIYGLKEVNFILNLFVEPFEYMDEGIVTGHIMLGDLQERYALHYRKTNGYILVYALHKII